VTCFEWRSWAHIFAATSAPVLLIANLGIDVAIHQIVIRTPSAQKAVKA
jgi:hypothetical protein